ncbi:hypothetical protein OG806_39805 [Streptomyces sp. NBC_00882]|uniref:hypothetical protein n=1 Tax=Streptomyces TaxID=1883 RepID=UPI003866156F|nr:hypothetical protein OG806_39805 [Streptomyces sp. NBC_00882]WSZ62080.1 hypothetical protein OH824_38715 [Streptomyces canus]
MTFLRGNGLLLGVGGILTVGLLMPPAGAVPAQAVTGSSLAVEGCSQKTDNRSSDGWTAADWKICIGSYGGPHGEIEAKCYAGQTIGWNANPCRIGGDFEIRKGEVVIKSGRFGVSVPLGGVNTAAAFRFSCAGHGVYTFRTTGVSATLIDSHGAPRQGYQSVNITGAQATVTVC